MNATQWIPPNPGIANWALDWLHGSDRWRSPRAHLATQLNYIRRAHGSAQAMGFCGYVKRIGEYPTRPQSGE